MDDASATCLGCVLLALALVVGLVGGFAIGVLLAVRYLDIM